MKRFQVMTANDHKNSIKRVFMKPGAVRLSVVLLSGLVTATLTSDETHAEPLVIGKAGITSPSYAVSKPDRLFWGFRADSWRKSSLHLYHLIDPTQPLWEPQA